MTFADEQLKMCVGGVSVAVEQIAEPPSSRRVVCYPVQLATPAPLPAAVLDRKEQGEMTLLTFRGDTQRLNTPYFHKMVSACKQLEPPDMFIDHMLHFLYVLVVVMQCVWLAG